VIKKLDRLIIKAFIGPFFITFLIALFILVMQFFWKYIDDLVGKGLDTGTLLELTGLVTTTWVPIALPLAILLSSIMCFGNLGESFELVAIKSAGIPLLRFMRPLLFISGLLCLLAFQFANYVIPVANLKFQTLLQDVSVKKPAFDIKEGVFYNKIPGYTLKISTKDKTGTRIGGVLIFEQGNLLQDNMISAENGLMTLSSDQRSLDFMLMNGQYYEEKGPRYSTATNFIRMRFKDYTKHLDLSALQFNRTADSTYKNSAPMLSERQLTIWIDSLRNQAREYMQNSYRGIRGYLHFDRIHDTAWKQAKMAPAHWLPDSLNANNSQRAQQMVQGLRNQVDIQLLEFQGQETNILNYQVERQRKYSLSFACLVLFMIGAPLGSIIRKGGLGMPLVCAVIFFVIFHLLNTFGEKFAKAGTLSPFVGMWLSVLVMLPIGMFLTYKAMKDSQLFSKEFYFRSLNAVRAAWVRFRSPRT
jgi:lipopolysaccharide export system permease protein